MRKNIKGMKFWAVRNPENGLCYYTRLDKQVAIDDFDFAGEKGYTQLVELEVKAVYTKNPEFILLEGDNK